MSECPPGVHSIFDPCPGNCTEDSDDGNEEDRIEAEGSEQRSDEAEQAADATDADATRVGANRARQEALRVAALVTSAYRAAQEPCCICGRTTHRSGQHVSNADYQRLCDRCWQGWCRERGAVRCTLAQCPCGCKGGGGR